MTGSLPYQRKEGVIAVILYFLGFYAFYLSLVTMFGTGTIGFSPLVNKVYRAVFLLLSCSMFLYMLQKGRVNIPRWFIVAFLLFWFAWYARYLLDFYLYKRLYPISRGEYLQRSLFMTLLPSLGFAFYVLPKYSLKAFLGVHASLLGFAVLVLVFYRDTLSIGAYRSLEWQGVDSTSLINPLAISYGGAFLVGLSLWRLTFATLRPIMLAYLMTSIMCGAFAVILGGSRGPIVAVVIVFAVLFFANLKKRKIFKRFALMLLAGVLAFIVSMFHPTGRSTLHRIYLLFDQVKHLDPNAGSGRLALYEGAFNQFKSSPLIGDSLVENRSMYFPHNNILEAFMATGVIGGLPFLVLFCSGVYWALRMQGKDDPNGWIGIFFLMWAVRGMFGSLIFLTGFWYLLVSVIACTEVYRVQRKNINSNQRPALYKKTSRYARNT